MIMEILNGVNSMIVLFNGKMIGEWLNVQTMVIFIVIVIVKMMYIVLMIVLDNGLVPNLLIMSNYSLMIMINIMIKKSIWLISIKMII